MLQGLFMARQEILVERGQRIRLLLELAQMDHRLVVLGAAVGHPADAAAQRILARLRHLVFVVVAFGELLQFLIDLLRQGRLLLP